MTEMVEAVETPALEDDVPSAEEWHVE